MATQLTHDASPFPPSGGRVLSMSCNLVSKDVNVSNMIFICWSNFDNDDVIELSEFVTSEAADIRDRFDFFEDVELRPELSVCD